MVMNVTALQTLRKSLMQQNRYVLEYIIQDEVLEWLSGTKKWLNASKEEELEFGKRILGRTTNQWTTKVCESILKETLMLLGKEPNAPIMKTCSNGKKLKPDWECNDAMYECKARTYSITGTAGEKILGTPYKYAECPRLYGKPLYIVVMAYQEHEAVNSFQLFTPKSHEQKDMLVYYENMGIKYVKYTDLLKELNEMYVK